MKLEFSGQIFEKYSSIKSDENPPGGSGWTDRQTDRTRPIVAFRNSVNAHTICSCVRRCLIQSVAVLGGASYQYVLKLQFLSLRAAIKDIHDIVLSSVDNLLTVHTKNVHCFARNLASAFQT